MRISKEEDSSLKNGSVKCTLIRGTAARTLLSGALRWAALVN